MLRKSAARRFRRSSPRPAGNPAEVRAAAFRRTVRARRTQRASRQLRHRSGRKRLKKCHSTTPAGDRHVDRVLRARLRNLDGPVAQVDDRLIDPRHLVAEDQRIAPPRLRAEGIERHGSLDLLHGMDRIARTPQFGDALRGRRMVAPRHGRLGAERRLVDIAVGGVAVMPQSSMRSTAKASPVRKKAPTFCSERMLSSTTTTGILAIAANSSAVGRPSSSLVILRMG